MYHLRTGIIPIRLLKVKSKTNTEWHFARVCMVKRKIFSNKLTPYDTLDNSEITEMEYFDKESYEYRPVDISSLRSRNLFSKDYFFEYAD